MKFTPSKLVGSLAAAYVLVVVGGIFIHYFVSGELGTLQYSLTLPPTLLVIFLGSAIAWGLWQGFAWAWWLGLAAVLVQLSRFGPWFLERLGKGHITPVSWLIGFLLVAFLATLLSRGARASCRR